MKPPCKECARYSRMSFNENLNMYVEHDVKDGNCITKRKKLIGNCITGERDEVVSTSRPSHIRRLFCRFVPKEEA